MINGDNGVGVRATATIARHDCEETGVAIGNQAAELGHRTGVIAVGNGSKVARQGAQSIAQGAQTRKRRQCREPSITVGSSAQALPSNRCPSRSAPAFRERDIRRTASRSAPARKPARQRRRRARPSTVRSTNFAGTESDERGERRRGGRRAADPERRSGTSGRDEHLDARQRLAVVSEQSGDRRARHHRRRRQDALLRRQRRRHARRQLQQRRRHRRQRVGGGRRNESRRAQAAPRSAGRDGEQREHVALGSVRGPAPRRRPRARPSAAPCTAYAGTWPDERGERAAAPVPSSRSRTWPRARSVSGSTDAVNGSQLYATDQAVDNLASVVTANAKHYYSVNDGAHARRQLQQRRRHRSQRIGGGRSAAAASGASSFTETAMRASALADNAVALNTLSSASVVGGMAISSGSVSDRAVLSRRRQSIANGTHAIPFSTADQILLGAVSFGSAGVRQHVSSVGGRRGWHAGTRRRHDPAVGRRVVVVCRDGAS